MNMLEGKLQMTVYHSEMILHTRHKERSKCVGRGGGGLLCLLHENPYHQRLLFLKRTYYVYWPSFTECFTGQLDNSKLFTLHVCIYLSTHIYAPLQRVPCSSETVTMHTHLHILVAQHWKPLRVQYYTEGHFNT